MQTLRLYIISHRPGQPIADVDLEQRFALRIGSYGDLLPSAACDDAMATALLNRKMPF